MKKEKENKSKKTKEKIIATEFSRKANKITIENHKSAAAHHEEAAKYHREAAKHYEEGNHEKAAYYSLLAHGHHAIAGEFLNDDAKHHAQSLKQINYHK